MAPGFLRIVFVWLSVCCFTLAGFGSEEGNDLRAADAELNRSYKNAIEAMPTAAAKAKLRDAQQAWVAFRDADLALKETLPGASGNTLKMYQTELTEARTNQLKALIEEAGQ